MKKLRILALMHEDLVPPDDVERPRRRRGRLEDGVRRHQSRCASSATRCTPLGVGDDLGVIRKAIDEWKPHIAFNLLEDFHGVPIFDQNVVSYLELLRIPYTGCNPRGLMLARDKALSKKLLAYHRIPVPEFAVVPDRAARCGGRSGCSSRSSSSR